MSNEVSRSTSASTDAKFRSPAGFLVYTQLDQPDRKFDPAGTYSVNLHLTVAELSAVEAELTRVFTDAYPDETRAPHLPFRRSRDGQLTLYAKARSRPKVVDDRWRPIITARAGSRARVLGYARPYRFEDRRGVTLYVATVQVIALDARDPRRERSALEREALRQAAARVRTGRTA